MELLSKVELSIIMLHLHWKDCISLSYLNKKIYNMIKKNEDYMWKLKYKKEDCLKGKHKEHFIKMEREQGTWILYHKGVLSYDLEYPVSLSTSVWDKREGFKTDIDREEDYWEYPSLFILGILPPLKTKIYVYEINNYDEDIYKFFFDTNIKNIKLEHDIEINTSITLESNVNHIFYELTI
jgi:hypothetical protein